MYIWKIFLSFYFFTISCTQYKFFLELPLKRSKLVMKSNVNGRHTKDIRVKRHQWCVKKLKTFLSIILTFAFPVSILSYCQCSWTQLRCWKRTKGKSEIDLRSWTYQLQLRSQITTGATDRCGYNSLISKE